MFQLKTTNVRPIVYVGQKAEKRKLEAKTNPEAKAKAKNKKKTKAEQGVKTEQVKEEPAPSFSELDGEALESEDEASDSGEKND